MPYGSARDLPKVQEMLAQLKLMSVAKWLLPREQRSQPRAIKEQLESLTRTVDEFYALLGSRHWIFHEDLSLADMADIVANHQNDPVGAQNALIRWYQSGDQLAFLVRRLSWHEAWRARMPLLLNALKDYSEGRYYAVVQVLLSVMDGFVNDLEPADRKGLHARKPDDLDAWNSVVGHHDGLTAAHETYRKSFKARSDLEVTELYRNGLVHGMLVNYDNEVVATKAWNRLFAVSDWARSLQALSSEAQKPPPPTLRETLAHYADVQAEQKVIAQFEPATLTAEDSAFEAHSAKIATEEFLRAWQKCQYGLIPPMVAHLAGAVSPRDVRNDYEGCVLDAYRIERVQEQGAAVCHVQVELSINGEQRHPELRWLYEDSDGRLAVPGRSRGRWRLAWWGSAWMLRDRDPQ